MYQLSVCAETVFLDLPFEERVRKITEAGFWVEFWGWKGRDLDVFKDEKVRVSCCLGSNAGSMVHPDHLEAYLADTEKSVPVAKEIRCGRLILLAGELGPKGEVVHQTEPNLITRWITAYKALCHLAAVAEAHDIIFCLEHLNTKVDHAGYCIHRVENAVRLVREVNSPNLKILMDVYHAQVEEGNVIQLLRDYHSYIGHVHVADVPGRHEPGTGEMNYDRIAGVLREVGYDGAVGLEAFPEDNSEEALARFRSVFA